MRITPDEKDAIVTVLRSFPGCAGAALFLVGSRADPRAKGGDIDVLVVCANHANRESLRNAKEAAVVRIQESIGEQRIDLTVIDEAQVDEPFFRIMLNRAVPLG